MIRAVAARRLLLPEAEGKDTRGEDRKSRLIHGETTEKIFEAARKVHSRLGPGLLERPYGICLGIELERAGLKFEREKPYPVVYDGFVISLGYKADFVVEEKVIVEVKSVQSLLPIHEAQLISYLRLSGVRVGLLLNFNVTLLKLGTVRRVYGFWECEH
jgi:GxxExxY protein